MIHKLILQNFKKIKNEIFDFTEFELIVGANNSGKSTTLQALAIWQYCVDQFKQAKKKGGRGIQVVLPNFTALPLPEFNLLWTDRTDREYVEDSSKNTGKAQNYIYIEIDVFWKDEDGNEQNFCVQMRYQSPQAVFAIPKDGWESFVKSEKMPNFPRIVYVPPFSGLEPHEKWIDDGNVRQNIGKAQPGSVLRNLLFRVIDRPGVSIKDNQDWKEIVTKTKDWFGIELTVPEYEKGISTEIIAEYKVDKKKYDIIAAGSGFHQIITLLAFVYGYPEVTTILFDEPDAHLHVNLQRQIINYFKLNRSKQFLIATHSEEFIKGVEISSVISILSGKPIRIKSTAEVIHALSDVNNIDVIRTQSSPFILYVEGEDDERLLANWANIIEKTNIYQKFYPYILGGSTKDEMMEKADRHYKALKQIVPEVKRAILLDYDTDEVARNPPSSQSTFNEWKRKNIDNYLLVPNVWKKAVAKKMDIDINTPDVFLRRYLTLIDDFFTSQNLTLPPNSNWINANAQIFKIIDGKKLLFESNDSLFTQIRNINNDISINRVLLATSMDISEIHEDIIVFFENLTKITT